MIIKKIQLNNFRNFKKKIINFSDKTTVIVGDNASGKTNILESLYLLSAGKSFRARVEEEMIIYSGEIARVQGRANSSSSTPVASSLLSRATSSHRSVAATGQASSKVDTNQEKVNLEVVLTRGEITVGEDPEKTQRAPRKKLLVNGISRRLFNFAGNLKVVMFGPRDLDLVTESPSVRRKFLDFVLSQTDGEYRRATLSYEKGLRQRNRLLYRIREEGVSSSQLLFWNRLLIKNGDHITQKRSGFIEYANQTDNLDGQDFSLDYDKSIISETRLEQYAKEEVAAATTLVGPHRDDFVFRIQNPLRVKGPQGSETKSKIQNLSRFGSRGEQRMGVLWIKLAELDYIENQVDEKPVLLLDDIFSELDHEHRCVVMKFVGEQQTIITTADPHFIEDLKRVEKIKLKV